MAKVSIETLKSYFQRKSQPTERQFHDLIDTLQDSTEVTVDGRTIEKNNSDELNVVGYDHDGCLVYKNPADGRLVSTGAPPSDEHFLGAEDIGSGVLVPSWKAPQSGDIKNLYVVNNEEEFRSALSANLEPPKPRTIVCQQKIAFADSSPLLCGYGGAITIFAPAGLEFVRGGCSSWFGHYGYSVVQVFGDIHLPKNLDETAAVTFDRIYLSCRRLVADSVFNDVYIYPGSNVTAEVVVGSVTSGYLTIQNWIDDELSDHEDRISALEALEAVNGRYSQVSVMLPSTPAAWFAGIGGVFCKTSGGASEITLPTQDSVFAPTIGDWIDFHTIGGAINITPASGVTINGSYTGPFTVVNGMGRLYNQGVNTWRLAVAATSGGVGGLQVVTTQNSATVTFSGDGTTSSPLTATAIGGGSVGSFCQQNFHIAASNERFAPQGGIIYSSKVITHYSSAYNEVGIHVMSGTNDSVMFGIYNASESLVASTALTALSSAVPGRIFWVPLLTPVTLAAGTEYWYAVYTPQDPVTLNTLGFTRVFLDSAVCRSRWIGSIASMPATLGGTADEHLIHMVLRNS